MKTKATGSPRLGVIHVLQADLAHHRILNFSIVVFQMLSDFREVVGLPGCYVFPGHNGSALWIVIQNLKIMPL